MQEFLGIPYTLHIEENTNNTNVRITFAENSLSVPNIFLAISDDLWLSPSSLPKPTLPQWNPSDSDLIANLVKDNIPILYGQPGFQLDGGNGFLNLDIFGSAFFMLSRYEELVSQTRDEHDRFPATASIAYNSNFLDRPIVDEYVEVLWAAMRRIWPALERKVRQPRTLVSCDVDAPYICGSNSAFGLLKRLGGDVLKRRSANKVLQTLSSSLRGLKGDYSSDPYLKAIDWIMESNEKAGNRVAFYFITAHSHPTLDGCYNMDEPIIRDLLRRIATRGHEIGLHSSYNTYQDVAQTSREADKLRQTLAEEGIQQQTIGARQHFLRWQTPTTASNLEAAGMTYDSTLSFADRPGFRCGTCHEYPMYDLTQRRALNLRQRPLILMECSVIAERYMGMGYSKEALELMQSYKKTCHQFGGDFTLLWHNSHLTTARDKAFYLQLIN